MGLNRNCSVITDCVFRDEANQIVGFGVCLADDTCSCLSEFGWTGDLCNEVSAKVWLNRFFFVLRPILIFFLAIYCVSVLRKVLDFEPQEGINRENIKKTKGRLVFMISLNLVACFTFLTFINEIISLYDPTYLEPIDSDSNAFKGAILISKNTRPFIDSLRVFGLFSIAAAQALLAASWIDLVEGLKEFSKHKMKIYFMVQYRKVVPYFILAYFVGMIILVGLGADFVLVFPVIGILSIMIVALFIFGSNRIISLRKEFLDERKQDSVSLIRQSARYQICAIAVSVSVYSISYILGQIPEPKMFILGQKTANANFITAVFIIWGLTRYCNEILKNIILNDSIGKKQYSSFASNVHD